VSYITQQELTRRFGEDEVIQLTDRARTGAVDTDVLDQAIDDAGAEIDGYLAGRYRLPLDPVPRALVPLAANIVRYRLYDDAAPDEVRSRYEDAVKFLTALAKGQFSLGQPVEEESAADRPGPHFRARPRSFDDHTLKDYEGRL
jgi:phage gp36-like protein